MSYVPRPSSKNSGEFCATTIAAVGTVLFKMKWTTITAMKSGSRKKVFKPSYKPSYRNVCWKQQALGKSNTYALLENHEELP